MKHSLAAAATMLCLLLAGCFPGVRVLRNPGPADTGIRYYRPKPYLVLEPVADGDGQHVLVSLAYLPDFSEEYSIHVRSGFGTADVQIKLDQGWNLTQINQDLDSQTDEIIRAVGDAMSKVPAAYDVPGTFTVQARNVPLGYYEAAIGCDPSGRKQLYGWRYVGFLPFRQCPVDVTGSECLHCNELPGPLFGLVFEGQTLTFKPLQSINEAASGLDEGVAVSAQVTSHIARLPAVGR